MLLYAARSFSYAARSEDVLASARIHAASKESPCTRSKEVRSDMMLRIAVRRAEYSSGESQARTNGTVLTVSRASRNERMHELYEVYLTKRDR